ncbi:uncharacterized protein LOC125557364 [Nematostella vectensis]|uniref:uncharacterized protein LOC125557364 n=1 Tax=Nematostella vectensis TaxID=45351 RepID=UPI00207752BE|nr:uncharacterized protein LOC125557364 [Nematostella vectensis]
MRIDERFANSDKKKLTKTSLTSLASMRMGSPKKKAKMSSNSPSRTQTIRQSSDLYLFLANNWNSLDLQKTAMPLLHFANQYPGTALFLGIVSGLSVLPLVLFMTFVCTTLMFTILGFIMVEGTLISIACCFLAVTLFCVTCISLFCTTCLLFLWLVLSASGNVIEKIKQALKVSVPDLRNQQILQGHQPKYELQAYWKVE